MTDSRSLKDELDLVAVIRTLGLELKQRGSNYFALCPFHNETTASLSVNPRAQLWHCFGCGAGGDVFSFVQKRDGVGFRAALQKISDLVLVTPGLRRA